VAAGDGGSLRRRHPQSACTHDLDAFLHDNRDHSINFPCNAISPAADVQKLALTILVMNLCYLEEIFKRFVVRAHFLRESINFHVAYKLQIEQFP